MPKRAIIVTGSRRLTSSDIPNLPEVDVQAVIHGGCRGADTLVASHLCKCATGEFEEHIMPYGNYASGPVRNQALVDKAVELREDGYDVEAWVFPDNESRGTYDCWMKIKYANIPTTRWPGHKPRL